ncbi:hypothetical protein BHE74_00034554 [Ensete ventricosum]|uniref:Uncharacterized protein n=1 Tax=Ensete ventricosum TaxID=4639 RepID=A0A426YQC6_ENSVE|nr:hypothetical protein B296_00029388 [Ensete ventricosum]RWV85005.1 hypothetical protein GW17_00053238 [Ensete ventricosum]RWW58567.1 hypothetical protein BHE74_00034554 [Ensete ventricosum]RZS07845.1 hypothetical protein BHM03_00038732 [Ensete ventricosum]
MGESEEGFDGDGRESSTESGGRDPRVIEQPPIAARGEHRGVPFPGRGEMKLFPSPGSRLGGWDVFTRMLIRVVRLRALLRHRASF